MKKFSGNFALMLLALLIMLTACSDSTEADPGTGNADSGAVSEQEETAAVSESVTEISASVTNTAENTPFGKHGKISVSGTDLIDENGEKFQLYGMSTNGIAWYPDYVEYLSFMTLRNEWNTNCVRIAMYTDENLGYCTNGDKEELKALVREAVEYVDKLGMYAIIDWHILYDQNPNVYKNEAIEFFDEMSELYKDHDNIIYEICNEPNTSAKWSDVKDYANEVIPVIRGNDPDSVILVGTTTWCQDLDQAYADPLEFDNIMYSLHFYADTHKEWLRERASACIEGGLPVFVSEFSICDASGNGAANYEEGEKWFELIEKYNLSYMCWSLANNSASSSVLTENNVKKGGWKEEDLSEIGSWVVGKFRDE